MKIKIRLAAVTLLLLLSSIAIPGVMAYWSYAAGLPPHESGLSATLMPFAYKPEEILPQDPEHAENHMVVIEMILNEPNGGLNSTQGNKAMFLHRNLQDYDGVLYSQQKVTGGNLMNLFTTETAANIYFVIQTVSDTEIAVYTMSKPMVDSSGIGDTMTVYRTLIRKNGRTWSAEEAVVGYAKLKQVRVTGMTLLSFDPRLGEWKIGSLLTA